MHDASPGMHPAGPNNSTGAAASAGAQPSDAAAAAAAATAPAPTFTPRKPGVTDGVWDGQDKLAVREALEDAERIAKQVGKQHTALWTQELRTADKLQE